MAIVFVDDFSGYTVGQALPFGAWSGAGQIVGFGTPPDATQSMRVDTTAQFQKTVQKMTLYFSLAFDSHEFPGAVYEGANTDPAHPAPGWLNLVLERDFSVTIVGFPDNYIDGGSGTVANSMVQNKLFLQPGINHFVEISADFTVPAATVNIAATITIDNTIYCVGQYDTGHLPAATFLGARAINLHTFASTFFGGVFIDNLTLYDDIAQPIPNPAVPPLPNFRATQMVAEPLLQPTAENIRATQMVVETLKFPTNENVRVTQMVLEVIGRTGGVRPQYIKRVNARGAH